MTQEPLHFLLRILKYVRNLLTHPSSSVYVAEFLTPNFCCSEYQVLNKQAHVASGLHHRLHEHRKLSKDVFLVDIFIIFNL